MSDMSIGDALQTAHLEGEIDCDEVMFFERYSDMPMMLRLHLSIPRGFDGGYAVARRGCSWAYMIITVQLVERAPFGVLINAICDDLGATLNQHEAEALPSEPV